MGAYELMKHDKMKMKCFSNPASQNYGAGYAPRYANVQGTAQPNRQFFLIKNPASWPAAQSV